MTSSRSETDPALRALERLDGIIEHVRLWSAGDGMLDDLLFVRAALAAAETAPTSGRLVTDANNVNTLRWQSAEAAPLDGTGSGTTTDCTQEDVHVHPFRGPHRFTEWYPIPDTETADQPLCVLRVNHWGLHKGTDGSEWSWYVPTGHHSPAIQPDTETAGEAG